MNLPYAGEGPEKKLSRLLFWQKVQAYLGSSAFIHGKYLGLASAEAGDASVLLGMNVPPQNITLADVDPEAARAARQKFPTVRVYNEDVVVTAHRFKERFSGIFLDFCGPATESNLLRAELVAQHALAPQGVMGVNVFIGREVDFENRIKKLISTYSKDSNPAFRARAELMTRVFKESIYTKLAPIEYMHYSSPRSGSARPMCTFVGVPAHNRGPRKVLITRIYSETARKEIALLIEELPKANLLLNISSKSFPAIKAHLTRGTYK